MSKLPPNISDSRLVPVHDLAAEKAVLAAILYQNELADTLSLKPNDFYDIRNRDLFATAQCLRAAGRGIDELTLHDQTPHSSGTYISQLTHDHVSAAYVADHARIVREKAQVRALVAAATNMAEQAQAGADPGALWQRLEELVGPLPEWQTEADDFEAFTLAELKNRPRENVECVIDGLLKRGGLSIFSGDTKAGKSLTARTLTWAVATGHMWLGRKTTPGPVLYLALEEDQDDVEDHFWQMGLTEADPVTVAYMRPQGDAIRKLARLIDRTKPVLVIVDTIIHLLDIRDLNDYAEVSRKLKPLLDLARSSRAHLLLIHHTRKNGDSAYGADTLGSTAFRGITDTSLILKRHGEHGRSIQTMGRGRWARHIEEPLMLLLDHETGRIIPGCTKAEMDTHNLADEVLDWLQEQDEAVEEKTVKKEIKGDNNLIQKALRSLTEAGKIGRSGTGKRGDPYRYFSHLPTFPPREKSASQHSAAYGREQGTETGAAICGRQNRTQNLVAIEG